MAIFKKSLFIVFAFVLALASFIFIPQNKMQTTYATSEPTYDNTYTYNGEVDSAVNGLGDYAINEIEYLNVGGCLVFHLVFDSSKITSEFRFVRNKCVNTGSYTGYYDSFIFNWNSELVDMNIFVSARTKNLQGLRVNRASGYMALNILPNKGLYDFYFSQSKFKFTNWNTFTLEEPYSRVVDGITYYNRFDEKIFHSVNDSPNVISNDFTKILDMNSETQFFGTMQYDAGSYINAGYPGFSFNYDLDSGSSSFRNILYYNYWTTNFDYGESLKNFGYNMGTNKYILLENVEAYCYLHNENTVTTINDSKPSGFSSFVFSQSSSNIGNNVGFSLVDFSFNVDEFYFYIKKPIHRVNNTLILYNFDYVDFLDNVNGVEYSLSKGNDLYIVDYNGNVPNSKYIYIYNNDIQNITFDEYIYLYMTFNNSLFETDGAWLSFDMGFDFNFTYYTEPLVLNDGSYNYTFEKPAYKDGRIGFSMAPPQLHIPIEAWVYNAVIFLCFYCPIISDILGLLHINYFINSLMTVFTLFVGSSIGQFINACICFLLFWGIMKGLMPSMGGAFAGGVKNTYGSIDYINREFKRKVPKVKKHKFGNLSIEKRYQLRRKFNGHRQDTKIKDINLYNDTRALRKESKRILNGDYDKL